MKLTPIEHYIRDLEAACSWLDVTQGRATLCKQCLQEILDGAALSEKRLMACYEAFDLVEIYQLWRQNTKYFSGLKNNLTQIFKKGPLLTDEEQADNAKSVQSRNDAFSAIVAGRLLEAQFDVLQVEQCVRENTRVSTNADCTIKLYRQILNVECKRPHSLKNWMDLVEKAQSQIKRAGTKGFVVLDCSALIRPNDTVYPSDNAVLAAEEHADWIEHNIYNRARTILSTEVLGMLMYARVPSMIETAGLEEDPPSSRICVVTSFVIAPNLQDRFAIGATAAIAINLQTRQDTLNLRELSGFNARNY